MKKYQLLKRLLILTLPLLAVACDDDEETATTVDFLTIASSYNEIDGTGVVTLPLRNAGNTSNLDVDFSGTATEGEDFEFVGVTAEGVQVRIIDDNDLELMETIHVRLVRSGENLTGNSIHTINVVSNCEDTENPWLAYFEGDWDATEKYGETPNTWYGPYTIHLVQDIDDPTKFAFDNLYDSGCDAFMIFDLAAGTVYFPDQEPCGVPLTNSSGTFTIDECNGTQLNINLNFDGGDWLYTFQKL